MVTGANCNLFFPSFSYFPYFTISFHLPVVRLCCPAAGLTCLGAGAVVVLACSLQSLRHLRDYSQSASPRDADCISSSESAFQDSCGEIIWARWIKNIYLWSVVRAKFRRLHQASPTNTSSPPWGVPAWLEMLSIDAVPSCPGPRDPKKHGETLV